MINLHAHTAILIDADNVNLDYMEQVLKISEYHGELEICRAYGDWKQPKLANRRVKMEALNIECIQVDQVGKNATDHRLLFDAGGILENYFSGNSVNVFIFVSGDGDFASACKFIRESGTELVIIGHRENTSASLRENCDTLYCLEDLTNEFSKLKKLHPIPPSDVRRFLRPLLYAYRDLTDKKYDWVSYAQLGAKLRENNSDYEREFGKYDLSTWLRNFNPGYESNENTQMMRRVDTNPDSTRYDLLLHAYIDTKGPDEWTSLSKLGKAARDADYNNLLGGKKISAWLKTYPDAFEIIGDKVIYKIP